MSVIRDLQESYESIYYNKKSLFENIVDFCVLANIFNTIESAELFAEEIIQNDLVDTFLNETKSFCYESDLLWESYNNLTESFIIEAEGIADFMNPIGLVSAGIGALGMAKDAAGNLIRNAQTLMSRRNTPSSGSSSRASSNRGRGGSAGGGSNRPPSNDDKPKFTPTVRDRNPIRATGPAPNNSQLQRLSNYSWRQTQQYSRPSGSRISPGTAVATGTGISGAGVAAGGLGSSRSTQNRTQSQSSTNRYNTQDPSGRIRDRLAVGPAIVGPARVGEKTSAAKDFDRAYAQAKQTGGMGSKFTWRGKEYSVY